MGGSRRKTLVSSLLLVLSVFSTVVLAEELDHATDVAEQHIRVGDLVFRRGRGLASEVARNFSADERRFSHVGIAVLKEDGFAVIHAIHDIDNNRDGVVMDSLRSFLDETNDWAIYRISVLPSERNTVARMAIEANEAAIPFDRRFDLSSRDQVYCTELVWRIVNNAVGDDLIRPRLSAGNRPIVSISDVYAHKSIQYVVGADSLRRVRDKRQTSPEPMSMPISGTSARISGDAGPSQNIEFGFGNLTQR